MDIDTAGLLIVPITLMVIIICVLLHYEGLRLFTIWITGNRLQPRMKIAALIFAQLLLHMVEIVFFGWVFFALTSSNLAFGALQPDEPLQFYDYIYFSAAVYSTLGFGDLVPSGPIRILTGMEAVTGLLLITWSASFTFLEMQHYWRNR